MKPYSRAEIPTTHTPMIKWGHHEMQAGDVVEVDGVWHIVGQDGNLRIVELDTPVSKNRCRYCGQFGKSETACRHCGAPIG